MFDREWFVWLESEGYLVPFPRFRYLFCSPACVEEICDCGDGDEEVSSRPVRDLVRTSLELNLRLRMASRPSVSVTSPSISQLVSPVCGGSAILGTRGSYVSRICAMSSPSESEYI